jgi:hypothetical protein
VASRFPSRSLKAFHVVLVGAGIAFCFGFAGYELLVPFRQATESAPQRAAALLAAGSLVGGLLLSVYLWAFLRRTRGG